MCSVSTYMPPTGEEDAGYVTNVANFKRVLEKVSIKISTILQ